MRWRKSNIVLEGIGLLVFGFLCWRMVELAWMYTDLNPFTGFLALKQRALRHEHWRIAFYSHVFSSIWVLLLGIPQFVPALRRRFLHAHRQMGIAYAVTILVFAGPSGLLMAFYAHGGLPSKISFTLLALLWMLTTGLAWVAARRHQVARHRAWMMRSYALTLSAVCLRVYTSISLGYLHADAQTTYLVVSWLAWVPNLLVAEWLIRRKNT